MITNFTLELANDFTQCCSYYPIPDRSGDGVLFSIDFFVCLTFFVSLLARYKKMAGPICIKFSGKVRSDHGTT